MDKNKAIEAAYWAAPVCGDPNDIDKRAKHIEQSLLASGFAIVPVEPTEEMVDAGNLMMPITGKTWIENGKIHFEPYYPRHSEFVSCVEAYRTMIAVNSKERTANDT